MEVEYKEPILLEDLGMHYPTEKSKEKKRFGLYKCGYCGKEFRAHTAAIISGNTKGCGCLRGVNHNLSKHKLYSTWTNMVGRCTNPNKGSYSTYGARGIKVCEEWLEVKNFIAWADSTYIEGMTLDRIDNDGNYEPSNCRWADRSTQNANIGLRVTNKSRYIGINYIIEGGRYEAKICINRKRVHLGTFKTIEEAVEVRDNYIIENNLPHKLSKDYIKKEVDE